MREVRKFTLIEASLIATNVVLLLALFVPLAANSVAKDREWTCAANLRLLGQAVALYAADHNGFLPASTQGRNPVTGTNWTGVGLGEGRVIDLEQPGHVTSYIGDRLENKICPDIREEVLAQLRDGSCKGGGYGYNANAGWSAVPDPRFYGGWVNVSTLPAPSEAAAFADTLEILPEEYDRAYTYRMTGRKIFARGSWMPQPPSNHFRHNGRANIVFFDGHLGSELPGELGEGEREFNHRIGYLGNADDNRYQVRVIRMENVTPLPPFKSQCEQNETTSNAGDKK